MNKGLLLLLGLAVGALAACGGDHSMEGLAAGTVSFQATSGSSNAYLSSTFTSNFAQTFSQAPFVAFGIWDANFGAASAQQFGQFSIQVTDRKPSSANFVFSYKSSIWTSVRIGYWANVRPDIVVGTSSADFGSLRNAYYLTNVETPPNLNYDRAIIRAFINGFGLNSGSTGIQIQVDGRSIQANGLTIVTLTGPRTDLKKLWFSYIAFSPSTAAFTSYGGTVADTSFLGTNAKDVKSLVQHNNYGLVGLNKISSTFSLRYSTDVDADFIFSYTVAGNNVDFVANYIFVGPRTNTVCSRCTETYSHRDQCVASCPAGTFQKPYNMGGIACISCSPKLNLVLNAQRTECVCASGYASNNGVCTLVAGGGSSTTVTAPVLPATLPFVNPNSNSYTPNQPTQTVTPQVIPTPPVVPINPNPTNPKPTNPSNLIYVDPTTAQNAQSCASFANTYWTGYRCACKVGFKQNLATGQCERLGIVVNPDPVGPVNCGINAFYNGTSCVCYIGYIQNSQGVCSANIVVVCPPFSTKVGDACICDQGYVKQGDICVIVQQPCGPNSSRNNAGICVCNPGYVLNNQGLCVVEQKCGTNEIYVVPGGCVCVPGYYRNPAGQCVRCSSGAVWDPVQNKCIFACGIQEYYNTQTNSCQCNAGYGKLNGICSLCTGIYFLNNGYCVTCPINSANVDGRCTCDPGYQLSNTGFCLSACGTNQVFVNGKCQCYQGLGYTSPNVCGICPNNQIPNPVTQVCGSCGVGQEFDGTKCVCKPGFGISGDNACTNCSSNGNFLLDGYCVSCPNGMVYNGVNCVCPAGQVMSNGQCKQQCQPGQLTDAAGLCYVCPLNQIVVDGACQCKPGYTKPPGALFCTLVCAPGKFLIGGACGVCALNTIYDPVNKVCACAPGNFMNNFGVCESNAIPITPCAANEYRDANRLCQPCPSGCKTCTSATTCTSCILPNQAPAGAQCVASCGNGFKASNEQCDDNNAVGGDGCSSTCTIEENYRCDVIDNLSVCRWAPVSTDCGNRQLNAGETCDDGNRVSGDGCSSTCKEETGYWCTAPTASSPSVCSNMRLVGQVGINSGAVYVTVETNTIFTFASQDEMQRFMKYRFEPGTEPASAYCLQSVQFPAQFNCLFNYPGGVPLRVYNIFLFYDYQGQKGSLTIEVDYRRSSFSTRSLS